MVDIKGRYCGHFGEGSTLSSGGYSSTTFDRSLLVVDRVKSELESRKRQTTEQSSTLEVGSLVFHA